MKIHESLDCPAAPQHWPDVVIWGVAAGTAEQPTRVIPINPKPVTEEWLQRVAPATGRESYRFAATCVRGGLGQIGKCRHWVSGQNGAEGDGVCSLVQRVLANRPPVVGFQLQPCGIRQSCRWFHQEGPGACRVCPGIATDIGALPQDADREYDVDFF
jgi:hypothetical protein